mmetsp:Transcript_38523/g.89552  ORF Transcript_38523/g.89552 Transcript_38523/m.89552 type:complete len:766 (-) Transcript_38523:107-2404(-)
MRYIAALFAFVSNVRTAAALGSVVQQGVRGNRDGTPVMGRGYSTSTNQIMSSCMVVPELTIPTFDYEFKLYEFKDTLQENGMSSGWGSGRSSLRNDMKRMMGGSDDVGNWLVFDKVLAHMDKANRQRTSGSAFGRSNKNTVHLTAMMKADMYYNSADESFVSMSTDAVALLRRGEYIGFMQACGPYFIRSIRRTKQIAATFKHTTTSSRASGSSTHVARSNGRVRTDTTTKLRTSRTANEENMEITVVGLGLSFLDAGPGTLMPKTLDDYEATMNYGFNCLKNQRSGLVESIEVIPWVASPSFQIAAKMDITLEGDECYEVLTRTCQGRQCSRDNTDPVSCLAACYERDSQNFADCSPGTCAANNCYTQNTKTAQTYTQIESGQGCTLNGNPVNCAQVCYQQDSESILDCTGGTACASACYLQDSNTTNTNFAYSTARQCLVDANFVSCTNTCYGPGISSPVMDCTTETCTGDACYRRYKDTMDFFNIEVSSATQCDTVNDYRLYQYNHFSFEQVILTEQKLDGLTSCTDDAPNNILRKQNLSPQLKQFNFLSNAEFLANIDAVVRSTFNQLELLSQCVGFLHAVDQNRLETYWVMNQNDPVVDEEYTKRTTTDIKNITEPLETDDFTLPLSAVRLKYLLTGDVCAGDISSCDAPKDSARFLYGREINKFVNFTTNFYSPCLTALSQSSLEFEGGKIMTHHWMTEDACNHPTCLVTGSEWDTTTCNFKAHMTTTVVSGYSSYSPTSDTDYSFLLNSYCMPIFRQV